MDTNKSYHLCYRTDFLFVKSGGPKVTSGILLWILNEHSVQVWDKIKVHFFFYLFAFLENTCFVCNSMEMAHWGCYNLYFEASKGLLLKNAP